MDQCKRCGRFLQPPPDVVFEKKCTKCGEWKYIEAFGRRRDRPSGRRSKCGRCENSANRDWIRRNPKKRHKQRKREWQVKKATEGRLQEISRRTFEWKLKTKYGMTLDAYTKRLASQHYECQLCGCALIPRKNIAIDHDHTTGVIRGILCRKCNRALGLLGDTTEDLYRAYRYLQASDKRIKVRHEESTA